MSALITIIHFIVCIVLILAVLLQSGKAADLAGAFGGVGSQTAFGPRGAATILSKATTICAVLFMLTSLGLWILSGRQGTTVLSGEEGQQKSEATAAETTKKEATTPAAPAQKQEEKKPPAKEQTSQNLPAVGEQQPAAKTPEKKSGAPEKK